MEYCGVEDDREGLHLQDVLQEAILRTLPGCQGHPKSHREFLKHTAREPGTMYLLQSLCLLMALAYNLMVVVVAQSSEATTKAPALSSTTSSSPTVVASSSATVLSSAPLRDWAIDNSMLFTASTVSTNASSLQLPEGLQAYNLSITTLVCQTVYNKTAISYNKGNENM